MASWLKDFKIDSFIVLCRENILFFYIGLVLFALFLSIIIAAVLKRRRKNKFLPSRILALLQRKENWDSRLEELVRQGGAALLEGLPQFYPNFSPAIKEEIERIAKEDAWLIQSLNCSQISPSLNGKAWAKIWQIIPNEAVFPAIIEFLAAKDEALRMWGVEIIAAINDERIIPYLLAALLQPKKYLPARVGEALLACGPAAAELLVKILPRLDKEGQILTLNVLGQFGPVYSYMGLAGALEDENEDIRAAAASALGDSQHKGALALLLAASADMSRLVRSAAAKALGQIGDEKAIPRLQALLEDEDFCVRANAKEAAEIILEAGQKRAI